MEQTIEQKRTREIVAKAIEKAWEDEAFKEQLLSNPLEAMHSLTGQKVVFPEGREVVFVDQETAPESTEKTTYINIAKQSNADDFELNEEQLEAVAGGQNIIPFLIPIDLPIICPPYIPPTIGPMKI